MLVVNFAILSCVLRTTTKKGNQLLRKNVHPRENPGYAYESDGYTSGGGAYRLLVEKCLICIGGLFVPCSSI